MYIGESMYACVPSCNNVSNVRIRIRAHQMMILYCASEASLFLSILIFLDFELCAKMFVELLSIFGHLHKISMEHNICPK